MSIFFTIALTSGIVRVVTGSSNISVAEIKAGTFLFAVFMIILAIIVYIWSNIRQRIKLRKLFKRLNKDK
jgi:hypothetical protein